MTVAKLAITLLLGVAAMVFLFPAGGTDSLPPTCYSLFAYYYVPCDGWVAPAAGAATAGTVGFALWLSDRLRKRRGVQSG